MDFADIVVAGAVLIALGWAIAVARLPAPTSAQGSGQRALLDVLLSFLFLFARDAVRVSKSTGGRDPCSTPF